MKILSDKAIVIRLEKIDKAFLDSMPNLEVIGAPTTGLDHLDLEECKKRKIKVISLKGEHFLKYITSTAEHTFGLILSLLRNYRTALNTPYKDREEYKGHTLSEKTLGIIGYGRVGKQMSKIAKGFGMDVLTYEKGEPTRYLFKLLRESDIVTLHIPLEGNEGFFTGDLFALMKPSAYLINTSRSGVIVTQHLTWALNNNIISGVAIDFIDDPELLEYSQNNQKLILTNHIGGCTEEDMKTTEDFITKKVKNYGI